VLLTAALGLLLISLTLPWLTINLFGQRSYSAFDNMQILTDAQKEEEENPGGTSFENNIKPQNDLVIADLTAVYPNSSSAFILSILILYPISIAVMVGAIVFSAIGKKGGSKTKLVLSSRIGLIAGILAIITAVLWIYSIQSFKDQFSRDADLSGGIIGEEWKGNANVIIDRLIVIGVGQYLVIASGVIAIFSHFIGNTYHKYENHPYHTTASEG
jgi:MFS family permease